MSDVLDSLLGPVVPPPGGPRAGTGLTVEAVPGSAVLERNLRALSRAWSSAGGGGGEGGKGGGAGALVGSIRSAAPRADLVWVKAEDGLEAAVLQGRALCSQRRPGVEAERLMERVDIGKSPVVVVTGFGVGWHVAEIARRLGRTGVVVVFEPDVGLLRAVLERVDHSAWLESSNLIVLTDAEDQAGMASACAGIEHALALGLAIVEHPASAARLGERARRFVRSIASVMEAVKTTVLTTMVQTEATLRNLTQNLGLYAAGPGIAGLRGAMAGRGAVCVAAGPSLSRNIDELVRAFGPGRPGLESGRPVLIAAQTVLRPLLARGVKPDFVTALDYHEASGRFYEGLTAASVEGVTLVVEPKVNPVVPRSFPGVVRCAGDGFLDELLGPELARDMGRVTAGATVAHLSYHLARFMGCDPVVLVGQDLGFTDGQYYGPGAAIHTTWAPELNAFNTLEMLEWQRVARHRAHLHPLTDTHGRRMYTDAQMHAYLVQFEAAFAADAARGLRTIDATEGGAAKAHTIARPLGPVLRELAAAGPAPGPGGAARTGPGADGPADGGTRPGAVRRRVARVRADAAEIASGSREAARLLEKMRAADGDQSRIGALIDRVHAVRDRVTRLAPAWGMVERLNQTGAFRRVRADRAMYVGERLEGLELQRRQIERDIDNVTWMGDAADALGAMLDDCAAALGGAAPVQRATPTGAGIGTAGSGGIGAGASAAGARAPVWALVWCSDRDGLGRPTDPAAPVYRGRSALELTLARLSRCRSLDGVAVLCPSVAEARRAAGAAGAGVRFLAMGPEDVPEPTAIRAARLWAASCWRGGLGGLTCYDEALAPAAAARALGELGAAGGAALIVGAGWSLVDPALCDAVVARYREAPDRHRVVFTQSGVGLCGAVVDARVCRDLAASRGRPGGGPERGGGGAGAVATIGGMLGYLPIAPRPDPLTGPMCVPVTPAVRDAPTRCVLDGPAQASWLLAALEAAGLDPVTADAESVARALERAAVGGGGWPAAPAPATAEVLVADAAGVRSAGGRVGFARGQGAEGVHLRVAAEIACAPLDEAELAAASGVLAAAGAEVISVECWAPGAPADSALAASARLIEGLLRERARAWGDEVGLRGPWIVPRLGRADATLDHLERWYDYWLMRCGWAVIDPPPASATGAERLLPLPEPELARRRAAWMAGAAARRGGGGS